MATVISNNIIKNHSVDKYNFKVLAFGAKSDESQTEETEDKYTADNHPEQRQTDVDSSALSQSSKDSLIESLMKKTDDMSSNFIKLQMKLEAKEEEHQQELQKAKEEGFAEGVEAGKAQLIDENKTTLENAANQFMTSVLTLENSAKEFNSSLENIKKELISAALDISKEVINVELSKNSAEIAKVLSQELIKELQSASKVVLKVNPKDHGFISEKVGLLEHVEIVSDSAVSEGGVIAISDAGNIDAQISKRFERVKRAALSE
jgi:flagellar assembly protein FliH